MKAKSILKDQKEHSCKYLDDNVHVNFSFIPLVLERNSVAKTPQCKIKSKNKKCKKLRPKKLRAYIPNEEQALSPVDLLKWQDKNILIIGKPGVGKTTVVQEMLRLWSEKDGREIDYMFYFDESVLAHSSNIASLQSILFDVYLKPMENDRMDVFKDIEENSENVVLILDGVTDFGKHSILWKIMNHELLPDAKIVITCRSEVEYEPLFRKWPTQKVYVQGFSKESINTYYHTMLGHDPVLLEVVLKNQELFSLSHVPLYASMIVDLMQFKNGTVCDHPHTVTEMYIHIFRAAVKKQIQQIDKYLKEIKDQVYYLMENAFNATMQKTLNVISCDETDISRAFLKMITIRDSPTSAMTYCAFLHNTMQEFFSALWLLGHPDEIEKVLQLCQTEEHKHMRHVLPFLCGLLSEHNIRLLKCLFPEDQIKKTSDWFIEKLLDTFLQPQSEESEDSEEFDLLFVSQCLYELQSPKACLMFLEKMDHQLEPEEDLDPHQCCALSYVIAQSRDKEVYLNLEDCTIADVGMNMMLSCSPNIRLNICKEPLEQTTFFLEFFHKASQCCCSFFDQRYNYNHEPLNALLDLCSHVKNYETQTGRSFLPALQSVFQSTPDVWIIDLSQRKSSVLLEVLKLQTEKKPVELRGCSEEESEMMSFLQCLPYISQLRFFNLRKSFHNRFLLKLFIKAAEIETQTGEQMLKLLSSVCTYSSFPYKSTDIIKQVDFLLDLCSHVKNYETQTGRSLLPGLQSVFQLPDVWIIDLSQRKSSVLLEVLKLQTEKKPVELIRCSEEESEMISLLQCLPYISQLRFDHWNNNYAVQFVLKLLIKAAETETQTEEQMLKLLKTVCTYSSFPYQWSDRIKQSDFLLDLCSHVKDYETQTGRSLLPALQSVFQSAPDVWIIDLSRRKSSILLEVLKLQTEKKPVELRGCSEEESEVMSLLQCLPYISQLSCSELCLLTLVKVVQYRENPELVTLLLEVLGFSFSLEGHLPSKTCRSVGRVLPFSSDRLNLTLKSKAISLKGTRLLFRHIKNLHTLRLSGYMVVRIAEALRSMWVQTPVTVYELTLNLNMEQWSERKLSRVLSNLAIILRLWTVQCLNLTEYNMLSVSLSVLLCHQGPVILRLSKETLRKLVEFVCEAQEEELTQCFLQKVGGDLTSCSLSWEELHYFLQHKIPHITVDLRKSNIGCNVRKMLPFFNRIQFKR
uniref:NACHT domain-containing protein n=1 Tax=Cyprinus carpio carpio TaxID=630221 RepID=A0A9J7Y458_CYPCA